MNTKNILIATWITAGILGVIAYFTVFYTSGNYIVKEKANNAPTNVYSTPTSTASSTIGLGGSTSTVSSTTSGTALGTGGVNETYASIYSSPAAQWQEGGETMSITGASLRGNQLTLDLEIDMGGKMECVPMNLRLLADESGTLQAPATAQFSFPETGTCQGAPDATYGGQEVVFTIGNTIAFPLFITTGGASNIFLQVSTTTDGGISVILPQQSG